MKKTTPPLETIDDVRITAWLDRFHGYRKTVTNNGIRKWLKNFGDDTKLGAKVLDGVLFIKYDDMETALRETVNRLPGWHRTEARRQGTWRFVAFSGSAGESGDSIIHRARTALGLSSRRYDNLFIYRQQLLGASLGTDDTVVFVDDFAGTGQQHCDGWLGRNDWHGLAELLPGNPKTYLVLVAAAQQGVDRIKSETDLDVFAHRLLSRADNVFSRDCQCFSASDKKNLLKYCTRASRTNPRGYGKCGLLLVFAHKTPNNSIPILHANHSRWRGLFPRH